MKIQIILTQEEITLFTIRNQRISEMQLGLNKIQADFNRLNNDLQLEKATQDVVLKSIRQRWQLEESEERSSLVFPDSLPIRFENGRISFEIPDVVKQDETVIDNEIEQPLES